MKTLKQIAAALLATAAFFTSCSPDDDDNDGGIGSIYIVNYGSYGSVTSTLTTYDAVAMETSQGAYKNANDGDAMTSSVQYAAQIGDEIYFMGNEADQVFEVNAQTLVQSTNPVADDLVKPRFCVSYGDYLYISCWGGNVWSDETLSYIAKFNKSSRTVESTISLPGGPEGLAIANGKIFAALNYKDSVAVISIDEETVSYIATPAVSTYFLKDADDNLYVSLISTWSDYSTETGLGYINTKDQTLEATYQLDGVNSDYGQIMAFNSNKSKIYLATSSGYPNYLGGVYIFDVASGKFEEETLTNGIAGISSVAVNPETNDVYVQVSESTTAAGQMRVFNSTGDSLTTVATGISPKWTLFIED